MTIGPEFLITRHELRAVADELRVTIESTLKEGNDVLVNILTGAEFSFFFDGCDRMYLDISLMGGRIYCQRDLDKPPLERTAQSATPRRHVASLIAEPTAAVMLTTLSNQLFYRKRLLLFIDKMLPAPRHRGGI